MRRYRALLLGKQHCVKVLGRKAFDIGGQMPPRTAARYSNRCALRPSRAGIRTRAMLHRLCRIDSAVPTGPAGPGKMLTA